MVQSEIKTLNEVRGELEKLITRLDGVLYYSKTITVNEFNLLREAHDSIASARDTIEQLSKPQRIIFTEAKEIGYSNLEDCEHSKLEYSSGESIY